MDNFVVSALKYRPNRFSDVVGQEHIVTTLKNAIHNNQLAHSFLFCGPRGVGKTTCARILAQSINCENPGEDAEPCGECASCISFQKNNSFNIHEIDAASNNSVDDIRRLTDQVRFAPQAGKYKIYIIDEVHMLSTSAFNAFLKTLEEPPPYAVFILATTEKHKIIPTILSRCQIFDFNRIMIGDMVGHLERICGNENVEFEEDALHLIAQKADGALRDALSVFDRILSYSGNHMRLSDVVENLNLLDHDYFFRMTEYFLLQDVASALLTFRDILNRGFEGDTFIEGLSTHFRNLLVCKDEAMMELLEGGASLKTRYAKQAAITPASFLLTGLNQTNQCAIQYRTAKNKRLQVEMTLIKLAFVQKALSSAPSKTVPAKKTTVRGEQAQTAPQTTSTSTPQATKKNLTDQLIEQDTSVISTPPGSSPDKQVPKKEDQPLTGPTSGSKAETPTEEIPSSVSPPTGAPKAPPINAEQTGSTSTARLPKLGDMPKRVDKPVNLNEDKSEGTGITTEKEQKRIEKQWADFTTELGKQKVSVAATMKHATADWTDSGELRLTVENKVQAALMKKELSGFRDIFLKQHLSPPPVIFRVLASNDEDTPKSYTSQDKMNEMIKQNPALKDLQDQLGLELEF